MSCDASLDDTSHHARHVTSHHITSRNIKVATVQNYQSTYIINSTAVFVKIESSRTEIKSVIDTYPKRVHTKLML